MPNEEKRSALIGMAMTEKQGGSDVRAGTTVGVSMGGHAYQLTGHKWFCSAPMSDGFLVLAHTRARRRRRGAVVPVRAADAAARHAQRVPHPAAQGQARQPLERLGRGRVRRDGRLHPRRAGPRECGRSSRWCSARAWTACWAPPRACGSPSPRRCGTRAGREAFGALLVDQPAMTSVLADLALESEAAMLTGMRLAQLFEAEASDRDVALRRLATPVSKYWVCKRGPHHAYEALECLGGNGYTESFPLARRYREQPVMAIWEGSGNVIALDVLRALTRDADSAAAFAEELGDDPRGVIGARRARRAHARAARPARRGGRRATRSRRRDASASRSHSHSRRRSCSGTRRRRRRRGVHRRATGRGPRRRSTACCRRGRMPRPSSPATDATLRVGVECYRRIMTPQEIQTLTCLRRARDLIDRDYAKPLDVPTMAAKAFMSPSHFSRRFRAAYGETPYNYLMTRRIERAMALLRTASSVTDACMAVGCTSLGSFSSRFAEIVGDVAVGVPGSRAPRGQGDAGLRRQDADPPGAHRIEQDRRSGRRDGGLDLPAMSNRTPVLQHHRQRRRRVHRLLRRPRPRGAQRRGLGGYRWVTLGSDEQPELGIVLSVPHAGRSEADGDVLQELLTKGVLPDARLPLRRPRRHLRDSSRVRRRGAPGAHRPGMGRATARSATPRATWSGSRRPRRLTSRVGWTDAAAVRDRARRRWRRRRSRDDPLLPRPARRIAATPAMTGRPHGHRARGRGGSGRSAEDAASALVAAHVDSARRPRASSWGTSRRRIRARSRSTWRARGIGGFILMGANIPPTEGELRALTAALTTDPALPPLIAIDQEGGDVSPAAVGRVPLGAHAEGPARRTPARTPSPGAAALVLRAGIGVNFGIVADVTADPVELHLPAGARHDTGCRRRARRRGRRRREAGGAVDAQALPRARRRAGRLACRHPVDRRCRRTRGLAPMPLPFRRRDRRRRADR